MPTPKSQADKDKDFEDSRKLASELTTLVGNQIKGSNLNNREVLKLYAKVNRELYTKNIKTVDQLNRKQKEIARLVGNELKTLNKVVNRGARKAAKKKRTAAAKRLKAITRKKRTEGLVTAVTSLKTKSTKAKKKENEKK